MYTAIETGRIIRLFCYYGICNGEDSVGEKFGLASCTTKPKVNLNKAIKSWYIELERKVLHLKKAQNGKPVEMKCRKKWL